MDCCRSFAAGLAVLSLAGCAGGAVDIAPFETSQISLPAALPGAAAHTPTALAPGARPCPPLDAALYSEANRFTPFTPSWQRSLVLSEIQKNRALAEAIEAYEYCRKL